MIPPVALRLALLLCLVCGVSGTARAQVGGCAIAGLRPGPVGPKRLITAEDLVRLRDIGLSGSPDDPLALSPDGKTVAFQLRRADPKTNSYCTAIYALSLGRGHRLTQLDAGGDILFDHAFVNGGVLVRPVGAPADVVPAWSPDGRWVAYLRRDNDVTQLWRARTDGGGANAVTHSPIDIEAFAWSADGHYLVVATRPGLAAAAQAIRLEANTGYHFDDRVFPLQGAAPFAIDHEARRFDRIDPETGRPSAASKDDRHLVEPDPDPAAPGNASASARAPGGANATAFTRPTNPAKIFAGDSLYRDHRDGSPVSCLAVACRGRFVGLWWDHAGSTLYFMKREGFAANRLALYRWSASSRTPMNILSTNHLLTGCHVGVSTLICAEEAATQTRRIVSVALTSGAITPLFDPNPEMTHILFGPTRRLFWRTATGVEGYGDLALPPHYRKGTRLPLVVVQYESRGFLRGGTGDEYPIHLFAAAGFAVLSVQRPPPAGLLSPAATYQQAERAGLVDFADRRLVLASLEAGVAQLVEDGIADPHRIGLTGLSNGAITVQFALLHSHMFKAVAMSDCCEDLDSQAQGGVPVSRYFQSVGAPDPGDSRNPYWTDMSLSQNSDRISVPILIQTSDREFRDALLPVMALKARAKPVDLYVFEDEYHNKLHPEHRLAVYHRNLDWFNFWLRGTSSGLVATPADYARWSDWRTAQDRSTPPTGTTQGSRGTAPFPGPGFGLQ